MKKMTNLLTLAALATAGFATVAMAQDAVVQKTTTAIVTHEDGDQTTTHAVVTEETTTPATMIATHTVQTIMASPKNGARVTLIGTIGAKVGKDTYAFTDRTGVIDVEIDRKKMPKDMAVGQMVRIDGKIDWSTFKRHVQIDVHHVTLI